MSQPNVPLHPCEEALLTSEWPSDDKHGLPEDSLILPIVKDVVQGDFKGVLTNQLLHPLFALQNPSAIQEDGQLSELLQFKCGISEGLDDRTGDLLRLAVGVACLHSFIQINWTGPELGTTPEEVIKIHNPNITTILPTSLRSQVISSLSLGGEPAYHLAEHPAFLRLALDIFEKCGSVSAVWWRFRVMRIWQQVLDEPAGLDANFFSSVDALKEDFSKPPPAQDLEGGLVLERGLLQHLFTNDRTAAEDFVKAAHIVGLKYELTGALGKRTKFQQNDLTQLVVLAESRRRDNEEVDAAASKGDPEVEDDAKLPEALELNDDTLLEQTEFTSTANGGSGSNLSHIDPGNQPALHPLDQSILLALCLNVKNTSPSHGLTKEQMSPYVSRVITHPKNWSVHTMALLLRSRLEADRTRTVERSTLQLQALIDQMPTSDSTAKERLKYFHSILLPSKWEMQKELAMRFLSIGVVKSALEIFERLEMWEHVVRCWQAMERPDKGVAIVTELLEGKREEAEVVTERGKAGVGASQRPAMDSARLAKFWCLLGDLQPEKAHEHYEKAWEVSQHKSGRAMRSLGGYHFVRGNYEAAVPYLQRAAAINPLLSRTWFILGCSCLQLQRWPEARDAFARCVAVDDEDSESWNNLASVYLRLGQAESQRNDNGEAEDDETLVEDTNLIPKNVPFANKMLAFRALKHGLKYSYENWRMWSNYMIVAVDVGELSEACRALTRIVEERAAKEGDKCVDMDVVDRLVDAVTKADDVVDGEDPNPNSGKCLAPRVADLFSKALLPRFSSSPRIFRSYARFLVWQSAWGAAIEAYVNAYRASVVSDDRVASDLARFQEAVVELEELVDVMRNLGPRAAAEEVEGEKRKGNWQFQARGLVRTFMGRIKESFGEEPQWEKLQELLDELKN